MRLQEFHEYKNYKIAVIWIVIASKPCFQTNASLVPTARRSSSFRVSVHTEAQPSVAETKPVLAALPQEEDDEDYLEILEPNPPHDAMDALVRDIAAATAATQQNVAPAVSRASVAVASTSSAASSSAGEIPEQKHPHAMVSLLRDSASATNAAPQNAASPVMNANVILATPPAAASSTAGGYSSKFGKAIRSDDPTVVLYA